MTVNRTEAPVSRQCLGLLNMQDSAVSDVPRLHLGWLGPRPKRRHGHPGRSRPQMKAHSGTAQRQDEGVEDTAETECW